MEKEKIKIGKITESELVELFGSDSQKKSYEENGKFVSAYKTAIFKKINKYCKVEELGKENGRRTYEITEVYNYPLPSNFEKMNKSLYQYIVPLLLTSLINGHDENNKIDITLGKWAREINMVNKNYNLVKYNKEDSSDTFQYPIDTINEFYNKADDMIDWYITNALDYLKSAGLIIWRDVYRINTEISTGQVSIDQNGNVFTDISIDSHQASKEEMEYYSKCISIADSIAGINNASDRYYSKNSKWFNEVLKEELYKRKIKCVYKTYEAYYVNLDKCKFVLNRFGDLKFNQLIKDFNKEFTNMIVENAEKRFDRNPNNYVHCSDKNDYRLCFEGLCEVTVNSDTEYLGNRIKQHDFSDNYILRINKKHQDGEVLNAI